MTSSLSEVEIQKRFVKLLTEIQKKIDFQFFHIHNSDGSRKGSYFYAKNIGITSGVPDFAILLKDGVCVFFELKTLTGKCSPRQKTFQKIIKNLGFSTVVCFGWEDTKNKVLDIFRGK